MVSNFSDNLISYSNWYQTKGFTTFRYLEPPQLMVWKSYFFSVCFAPVPQYIHFTLTFILCPPKHFRILGLPQFELITWHWQSTNYTKWNKGSTIMTWVEWIQMLKSLIWQRLTILRNQTNATNVTMQAHLKTHSEEKSNKCNQCNYASAYAHYLRTHLNTNWI